MNKYELLETIGEGAYGIVIKAKCKETGKLVAIKRFKESDEDEMVRKTTLREVKILRSLKDETYIVKLLEAFRRKGRLYLVFEYVGKNLLELLEEHPNGIPEPQLKRMVFSMLLSVYACHSNGVIHRDIKPENLLLASDNTLRLCDFGFARQYQPQARDLTDYVATRWYRSPELLLGTTDYSLPTDLFAAGCIMAELVDGQPLFPGESELDQMRLIQKMLGPFTAQQQDVFAKNARFANQSLAFSGPEGSLDRRYGQRLHRNGIHLLKKLLSVDPANRPTAVQALQHPFLEGLAAELCPNLVPILAAAGSAGSAFPTGPAASPPPPELAMQARPDTRGGEGGGVGTRRRSANRMLLPSTGDENGSGLMPAIGSRPASRGDGPVTGDRQQGPGRGGNGSSSGALRNMGAPKPTSQGTTGMMYQPPQATYQPPQGTAGLPLHRTGSGHGRRGTGAALPKPARGPMDVLDSSHDGPAPSPSTFGPGGAPYSGGPYGGGQPAGYGSGSSLGQGGPSQAYGGGGAYSGSSMAFKVPSHGSNLPRLNHPGLPPSGNGPAPSAGLPPQASGGHGMPSSYGGSAGGPAYNYNPFLSNGRTRQPAGPGGGPGRY